MSHEIQKLDSLFGHLCMVQNNSALTGSGPRVFLTWSLAVRTSSGTGTASTDVRKQPTTPLRCCPKLHENIAAVVCLSTNFCHFLSSTQESHLLTAISLCCSNIYSRSEPFAFFPVHCLLHPPIHNMATTTPSSKMITFEGRLKKAYTEIALTQDS